MSNLLFFKFYDVFCLYRSWRPKTCCTSWQSMQKMEKCLVSGNTFVNEWLINLWKDWRASIVFDICGSPKTSCPVVVDIEVWRGENYLDQLCRQCSESVSEHRARQVLDFQALCNYVKGISCSTSACPHHLGI